MGKYTDKGNLIDEGFEVGGFFAREVAFHATSVKTMFERVVVSERGAAPRDRSKVVGHKGSLRY